MGSRPDDEQRDPRHVVKPEHLRRGGRARPTPLDGDGHGGGALGPEQVDVEGEVLAGVETGSVVLRGGDGRTWQLGGSYAHLVGRTVALRGRPRREVMTTQQQGVPLEVLAVEVVDDPRGEGGSGS
jgi:hypothetical protein